MRLGLGCRARVRFRFRIKVRIRVKVRVNVRVRFKVSVRTRVRVGVRIGAGFTVGFRVRVRVWPRAVPRWWHMPARSWWPRLGPWGTAALAATGPARGPFAFALLLFGNVSEGRVSATRPGSEMPGMLRKGQAGY